MWKMELQELRINIRQRNKKKIVHGKTIDEDEKHKRQVMRTYLPFDNMSIIRNVLMMSARMTSTSMLSTSMRFRSMLMVVVTACYIWVVLKDTGQIRGNCFVCRACYASVKFNAGFGERCLGSTTDSSAD